MITLSDFSADIPAPGVQHLPRKSAKRRRIQMLQGSSSILQPYPCTEGDFFSRAGGLALHCFF